jgi:hypothetical protein
MGEYTDEQRAADRELLEAVRKFRCIHGEWDDVESAIRYKNRPTGTTRNHWNPLVNDDDAMTLMTAHGLTVEVCHDRTIVMARRNFGEGDVIYASAEELTRDGDRLTATRRAIVRCVYDLMPMTAASK